MILTFLALSANFNEDKLSYYVPYYDEQFTINDVLKRPDKESFSNLVNFESLKGIWSFFFLVTNALITFPKQDNEKLIFLVSSKAYRDTPALFIFSLPAKSIKHIFDSYSWFFR